jgi:DNA-binding MarR family transcriptional regulator
MNDELKNNKERHPLAEIDQIIHAPARLLILVNLYVVESLDYVFLRNQTGLSWGNLSTHLAKLEGAGYVIIEKGYRGKKPQSRIRLTPQGRKAFREYKRGLQTILDDLPE